MPSGRQERPVTGSVDEGRPAGEAPPAGPVRPRPGLAFGSGAARPGAGPAPPPRGHGAPGGRGGGGPLRRPRGGGLREPHRRGERRGVRLAAGHRHRPPGLGDPRGAPGRAGPRPLASGVPGHRRSPGAVRAGAHPSRPDGWRPGRGAQAAASPGAAGARRTRALLPPGGDGRGQRGVRPRRRSAGGPAHAAALGAHPRAGRRRRAGGPAARGPSRDARPRRPRGGGRRAAEPRGPHRPARAAQAARLGAHHRHRRIGGPRRSHRLRGGRLRQRGGTDPGLHPAGALGAARRGCRRGNRRLVQHSHRRSGLRPGDHPPRVRAESVQPHLPRQRHRHPRGPRGDGQRRDAGAGAVPAAERLGDPRLRRAWPPHRAPGLRVRPVAALERGALRRQSPGRGVGLARTTAAAGAGRHRRPGGGCPGPREPDGVGGGARVAQPCHRGQAGPLGRCWSPVR